MPRVVKLQVPSQLRELCEQIERWRLTRLSRTRIPEELWRAAAVVAKRVGIHPVAKALRLDYYDLKRRVDELSAPLARLSSHPGFIEVSPECPPAPSRVSLAVQMERADGARFQVQLSNVEQLLQLAEVFWRRRQ
jgi:hypothetical protein